MKKPIHYTINNTTQFTKKFIQKFGVQEYSRRIKKAQKIENKYLNPKYGHSQTS